MLEKLEKLKTILKQAGFLTNLVDRRISELKSSPQIKNPTEQLQYHKPISTFIPGANVMTPDNPFDSTGGYNVMFLFRYRPDTNWNNGINTILVMADVGEQYNTSWIANALSRIQTSLQKVNPNAHLKKYGISAHSGGYTVAGRLLRDRQELERMVGKPLDTLVLADAGHEKLHPSLMNAYVEFAKEALEGDRNFIDMHTAIPGEDYKGGTKRTYTSTTEHSDYILNQLGLSRQPVSTEEFQNWRIKPVSTTESGGLKVIQMDDKTNRPYNPDNRDAPGTSGYMHNETARHLPDAWRLLQGWN